MIKETAQQIIDRCDSYKFSPKEFRKELNISWIINDVKKKYKEVENQSPENQWIDEQNKLRSEKNDIR